MLIVYGPHFKKGYVKLSQRLKDKVAERLRIFARNEFDALLNNHPLKHEYDGYRSINVTGDWRIIYKKEGDGVGKLYDIGTHHQLFGK